jgi:hypothetical protein
MDAGSDRPALDDDRLLFATGLSVSLVRTTRVPEDGRAYPLTAHHGALPLRASANYRKSIDSDWIAHGDLFAPAYEGEAFFAAFEGTQPHAVQVDAGGTNAISGGPAGAPLADDPQNYVVAPPQQWLDGFYDGRRRVGQFTATFRGGHEAAALTFRVHPPRPGALTRHAASKDVLHGVDGVDGVDFDGSVRKAGAIDQAIVPDPLGVASWEPDAKKLRIHLVDVTWFRAITGEEPPPAPPAPPKYR